MTGDKRNIITEGKTKIIRAIHGLPDEIFIENKDDITSGDGARRSIIDGKGILATETTCNCFSLLNAFGIPNHFIDRVDERTFCAARMDMIPVEVVVRRIATGSYLKRNPEVEEGLIFKDLIVELFLKDDANHDPMMIWSQDKLSFELYDSHKPKSVGYIKDLPEVPLISKRVIDFTSIKNLAKRVFLIFESAWRAQNVAFVDFKVEFGYFSDGSLGIGDVIDNDSWRLWPGGDKTLMKDKQVYRNLENATPEALELIREKFLWVAEKTKNFAPKCNS